MNPRFCPSIIVLYIVASVAALFGRYERECILSSLQNEGMLERSTPCLVHGEHDCSRIIPAPDHLIDDVIEHIRQAGRIGIFELCSSKVENLDFVLLRIVFCNKLVMWGHFAYRV